MFELFRNTALTVERITSRWPEKMDQPRVLFGLPLDSASLANVRLRRACDHVLVSRRVEDGVVQLLRLVTGRESPKKQPNVCVLPDGRQEQSVPSSEGAAPGFGGCPSSSGDELN